MAPLSPWLIVILSFVAALGMWLLTRRGTYGWRMIALLTIPLSMSLVYAWIGLKELSIEAARNLVRYELLYSLSVAIYVIYSFYFNEAVSHKRRHDD